MKWSLLAAHWTVLQYNTCWPVWGPPARRFFFALSGPHAHTLGPF